VFVRVDATSENARGFPENFRNTAYQGAPVSASISVLTIWESEAQGIAIIESTWVANIASIALIVAKS